MDEQARRGHQYRRFYSDVKRQLGSEYVKDAGRADGQADPDYSGGYVFGWRRQAVVGRQRRGEGRVSRANWRLKGGLGESGRRFTYIPKRVLPGVQGNRSNSFDRRNERFGFIVRQGMRRDVGQGRSVLS